jgi:hypothetical protein
MINNQNYYSLDQIIKKIEKYRFSSPSADPDEIEADIYDFKLLAKRFIGYARKINNQDIQYALQQINVDTSGDIRETYDLHANLLVLIDAIKDLTSIELTAVQSEYIDLSIINHLSNINNKKYDVAKVIQFCREINGTFSSGYYLSTALLIRALINHIPPIFGQERFDQVVSQSTRSRKEIFKPLDDIARDIGDLHTHDTIRHKEVLPTRRQLEPFKPNVEFLLQEIITELNK